MILMNAYSKSSSFPFFVLALAIFLWTSQLSATERRFTYVYEATTAAPGEVEIENTVTWSTNVRSDSRFNEVDFRHELEFGITDRFQAALYFIDWFYQEDPLHNSHGFHYSDSALELIYRLTNPATDVVGSAVYGEIRGGKEFLELESRAILQKNVGPLVFAYNAILEARWEGRHLKQHAGEFSESLGASYEVTPRLFIGVEALHQVDIPDWSRQGPSIVYGGPNISYRHPNWYVTLTPLVQLTQIRDEVRFQARLLMGFEF